MAQQYDVEIAGNSPAGIRAIARQIGATHMRFLGCGFQEDRRDRTDHYIGFYAIPARNGDEALVDDTSAAPV
jgi:hypothetical protein